MYKVSVYTELRKQSYIRSSNRENYRHCTLTYVRYETYDVVSESFRTGRLERELQMVQLSATSCSYIATLRVSLVSFATVTLCVASQRVFIVVYFVINSVRKLLDTPSCKFQFDVNRLPVTR
jgi:hypothetical protein